MSSETDRNMTDDPGAARERAIADAVARFVDCQSRGETAEIGSFCRQNPSLLPELQTQLEAIQRIDAILDSGGELQGSARGKEAMPERLSGLRVVDELGSGGMGRVFLAVDERLNRKVAIKVLAACYWPDQLLADRFMREAQAMAQLSHPNVASIYSLGAADEPPHFVMEYVPGAPLTRAAGCLLYTSDAADE